MALYIPEIVVPGGWLQFDGEAEVRHELETMLHYHLTNSVCEAAIALGLFEDALQGNRATDRRAEWDRNRQIETEVQAAVRHEHGGDDFYVYTDAGRFEVESRVRRRKAELGIHPRSFTHKLAFLHAHSFVYAVDSFGKFLDVIAGYPGIPAGVRECQVHFDLQLPTVRKIRNSAMHIEDRARGYGPPREMRAGKKMELQGFLGLSNLEGNALCYTIDDGTYQKVEISAATLNLLVDLANKVLVQFEWHGPARIEPMY